MSAHTPGPWILHGLTVRRADGKHIASADFSRALMSTPEREANARLIAAAPVLLGELERVWALACHEDRDVDAETDWEAVRAAIAKARGKR